MTYFPKIKLVYLSLFIVATTACIGKKEDTLFKLMDPDFTGVNLTNTIKSTNEFNVFKYRNFYNGGGVGLGDINNDGLLDIYITRNIKGNKLYLNRGNFQFEDITDKAAVGGKKPWSTGVVMVDINNDGFLDIYVCNAGIYSGDEQDNELFINNQDGTFTEQAKEYNLADSGITTHAAFFDYDKDGDLDVYILNNSFIPITTLAYNNKRVLRDKDWDVPPTLKGGGDRLLRNDNNHFTDVSEEAGIYGSLIGFGLGITLGDINQDGFIDIYVSNDFYERDYLYINQGDGTFIEDIQNQLNHISNSSMGADMADIDNDGYSELFVTDMLPEDDQRLKETTEFEGFNIYRLKQKKTFYHQFMQNTLQLNNQNGTFSEISAFAGVEATDWSWGALMFDMNNDGYRDIFVSNGIYHEITNQDFVNFFANEVVQNLVFTGKKEEVMNIINKMPVRQIQNHAFKNNKDLSFTDTSLDWGFDKTTFSNGAAYGDLDNDGDLDLVINNVNQPAMLYKNTANEKGSNYLQIQLKGNQKNTFAVGSKIKVYTGDKILFSELIPTRGFQSSVDFISTIGLGKVNQVDSIQVIWPNNSETLLKNIEVNQRISLSINQATTMPKQERAKENLPKTYFQSISTEWDKHSENNYVDYDKEVLVPRMLSREGPPVVTSDVNNDGLDDIFLGNATNAAAQLLIQTKEGKFISTNLPLWDEEKKYEDTKAVFVDIDNDNDLDLFVGSGGNDVTLSNTLYQDRIYVNDGTGTFSKSKNALPTYITNTSVIAPYDMDQDGDIDFFIGNRSITGIYGIDPTSIFLENQGDGTFKNSTNLKAYEASKLGMVTDAKWIELTGDEKKDLLVVGEWMAPTVFENKTMFLESKPTNLLNYPGWWNTIVEGDYNGDGQIDFILGNKGLNSVYIGSVESPSRMFINDFDRNGTFDQILTREVNGKDKPIHVRNELISQIPKVKKENTEFSTYATKGIRDLFSSEDISTAIVKEVKESKTRLFINKNNLKFEVKDLPKQIQWNSVNTGLVKDFNQDGNLDVLLAGGEDNLKPQFGKLDAGYGELLLGNGKGGFDWKSYAQSGLKLRGTVRSSSHLILNEKDAVIFGLNDQKAVLYVSEN